MSPHVPPKWTVDHWRFMPAPRPSQPQAPAFASPLQPRLVAEARRSCTCACRGGPRTCFTMSKSQLGGLATRADLPVKCCRPAPVCLCREPMVWSWSGRPNTHNGVPSFPTIMEAASIGTCLNQYLTALCWFPSEHDMVNHHFPMEIYLFGFIACENAGS